MASKRRDFLGLSDKMGAGAVYAEYGSELNELFIQAADGPIRVIWLRGAGDSGCTTSLLQGVDPDLADALVYFQRAVGITPAFMTPSSDRALLSLSNALAGRTPPGGRSRLDADGGLQSVLVPVVATRGEGDLVLHRLRGGVGHAQDGDRPVLGRVDLRHRGEDLAPARHVELVVHEQRRHRPGRLGLALGGMPVTLEQLVGAYTALSTGGRRVPLRFYAEEEFLRKKFGEQYLRWADQTPAFLERHGADSLYALNDFLASPSRADVLQSLYYLRTNRLID